MICTGELRKGVVIELDGDLWQILDYHHIKMGRGSAQVRIKLRNVKKGSTVERSFQAGDRWPRACWTGGRSSSCTATATTSTSWRPRRTSSSACTRTSSTTRSRYLKDGMTLDRTSYQGETLGVELPVTVDLVVARPSRGSRATRRRARARRRPLETGLVVTVPLFVSEGDTSASTPGPASTRRAV